VSRRPKIELIVTGEDIAAGDLERLAARGRDATPAMRSILGQMATAEAELFRTSGERGGERWPEDKPSTLARKQLAHQDPRVERRTLALERALTANAGPPPGPGQRRLFGLGMAGRTGAIRRASKQQVRFGTTLFYALFQQHARPLIQFTQKDEEGWADTIGQWLLGSDEPTGPVQLTLMGA
jgi:hypothetical protein